MAGSTVLDPLLKYRDDPVEIDARGIDILQRTNQPAVIFFAILDGELYAAELSTPEIIKVFGVESFDADRLVVVYRQMRTLTLVGLKTSGSQYWHMTSIDSRLYVVHAALGYKYRTVTLLEVDRTNGELSQLRTKKYPRSSCPYFLNSHFSKR